MTARKSKIFRKREPSNRDPIARKLASAQFKPRLIPNKKKAQAKIVPDQDDW